MTKIKTALGIQKQGLNYREMNQQREFLIVMNNEQLQWLNEEAAKEICRRTEQLLIIAERNEKWKLKN